MEKGTIITLDDNTNYALLDETVFDGEKYFFAVLLDEEDNPTIEYEVFLEVLEDGEYYVDMLDESDFKQAILLDFTNNYMNSVEELMNNPEE